MLRPGEWGAGGGTGGGAGSAVGAAGGAVGAAGSAGGGVRVGWRDELWRCLHNSKSSFTAVNLVLIFITRAQGAPRHCGVEQSGSSPGS